MLWLGVFAILARSFGGFHPDEDKYLVANQACEALVADKDGAVAGKPRCVEIDRETQKGFRKPERGRETEDGKKLSVSVDDGKIKLVWLDGGSERLLARWSPGAPVTSVNMGVFAARGLVAVEYRAGAAADVVAFDVRAPLGTAPAPAPSRPSASSRTDDRTVMQRVLARGGVWEQRQRSCEQAGVHLVLSKDRKFDIRIETRCQGQKDTSRFQGIWAPDSKDSIVLVLTNEGAPEERIPCQIGVCPDIAEDCLSCAADEVTFLLYVVRR